MTVPEARALLLTPAALGLLGEFLPDLDASPFAAPMPDRASYVRRAALDGLRSRGLIVEDGEQLAAGAELAGFVAIAAVSREVLSVSIAGAESATVVWLLNDVSALEQRWVDERAAFAVQAIDPSTALRRGLTLATSPAPAVEEPEPGEATDGPMLGPDARRITIDRRRADGELVRGIRLEWIDGGDAGRWVVERPDADTPPTVREILGDDLEPLIAELFLPEAP